ncbi:response regulator [Arsenicibacter rosenii]|uniref:Response regulator n=1 Tax=Arsenicibacter rosenii TaxID=1750698 RepID=A0A1S2VFA4_9BACT|nr:response regulator [Arsenicibacter rosenii]OIN57404.1 response regulator [Arsenicibacter rosenii]
MESTQILLADDDDDDCLFFREALNELPLSTTLIMVHDGEQLMLLLMKNRDHLPHVLFLDLNMPRKSGHECLCEIKKDENLKHLPVVILSTAFEQDMADLLYQNGAQYCARKPANFSQLKQVIHQVLTLLREPATAPVSRVNFVIGG